MTESFPRQQARTRGFRLGVPRAFQVSADGDRVTFLRSRAGDDPVTCLWEADTVTGAERLVADPRALGADEENLPPEERARRERVRETAAGIVAYATDRAGALAVFALSGQVYAVPLGQAEPTPRLIATQTPALDPRPDSTGTKVAYVHDGALRVVDLVSGHDSVIAEAAEQDAVTFGLAEFVAAEEMGRSRGYWWSPDGSQLLIARVDESPVRRWYIADPANPDKAPTRCATRPPAPPTPTCRCCSPPSPRTPATAPRPSSRRSSWDRAAFPYLAAVAWDETPLMVVTSRDQKVMRLINAATGGLLREDADPDWTDVIDGLPAQLASGDIVWTAISDDTRGLVVAPAAGLQDARPLTPPGLQVLGVLGTDGDDVLFAGATEPTEIGVWRYGPGRADRGRHRARRPLRHRRGRRHRARPPRPGQQRPVGHGQQARRRGRDAAPDRVARPAPEPAPPAAEVPAGRPGRDPHRGALPVLAPARHQAAGAHGPLRRPAPPEGDEGHRRLPRLPVAGRAGVRGRGGGRPRHRRPWSRLGSRGRRRPRHRPARGPGHRPAGGGRGVRRPRHRAGGDPGLVLRRLPVRARAAAPPRRVPRGDRRRAGHRLAALRHVLHRALPR